MKVNGGGIHVASKDREIGARRWKTSEEIPVDLSRFMSSEHGLSHYGLANVVTAPFNTDAVHFVKNWHVYQALQVGRLTRTVKTHLRRTQRDDDKKIIDRG